MEGDSEEEWFFDSIKRYKELIMFDTGDPIQQIELCDKDTICLLCERNSGQKTITILKLPTKLTQTYLGSREIQQNNDLKIKTGFFPSSPPCWILAVYGENRLLTTVNDTSGLMVYNIKVCDTEQIAYNTTLNFSILNPTIALVNKTTVILTKDTRQKSLIGDLNNGETLWDLTLDDTCSNPVIPLCLDEKVAAFCEKSNGTTHLCDWKTNKVIGKIYAGEGCDAAIFPASNYSYIKKSNPSSNISFLSQAGIFKVYDLRNMTKPLLRHDLKLSTLKECLKVHFKPKNCNIVSVSGFDSDVYLFDISKNMTEIFKHDGHRRTQDCEKNTLVTDHLWYAEEFIISGALNNSINCWIPDNINR